MKSTKALFPILMGILFLAVGALATAAMLLWMNDFEGSLEQDYLKTGGIEVLRFENDILSVKNSGAYNYSYNDIQLGATRCGVSGEVLNLRITEINLSSCTGALTAGQTYDVVFFAGEDLITQRVTFR